MKKNAVTVGIGVIALFVLLLGLTGIWASSPTSVLASNPSIEALPVPEVPEVPACGPDWDVVTSPNVGTGSNYLTEVAVVSATPVPSDTPTDTPTSMPCTGWNVVNSPNVGSGNNYLLSSAAVGAGDIWAVGIYYDSTNRRQTLTEHWDGNSWSVMPSPNMGTGNNFLQAAVASSSSDVWAVGHWDLSGPGHQTLVEHWNGNNWSVVPSPNVGPYDNEFLGAAMVSANDIWAVGNYWDGARAATLIEHWDGSSWSVLSSPNVGTYSNDLLSVSASASNDVWTAGQSCGNSGCTSAQVLIEHWNGSSWSIVPSPSTGGVKNILRGIVARAGNDVWAVGYLCIVNCLTNRTLIEHWDGSTWSIVSSPNPGSLNFYVVVVAIAANDAWAAGTYSSDGTIFSNAMAHWDGSDWALISVTSPGSVDNELRALSAVSPGDIWAVGYSDNGSGTRTQIQHYTGPCATPTSTVQTTSTNTPVSGTAMPTDTPTAVQGTTDTPQPSYTPSTPVATSTSCPIQFTDVLPNSPFYSYIRCMACRGLVNGYSSGCESGNPCFRPANNVTRGQFAKIASNAAGFIEPPGAQQYEDVVPGSTFYDFIWRLASRGLISGYPCDGAGEPCGPNNLPYFRPNSNITRGQIAKIDANAAGYSDTSGPQQYEDVLPGSTFYDFIWRLSDRGLVNGYPCGGAGEPCGPGNLPYFRPAANATRGQASKIVSNTFFPSCQTP